MTRIRLKLNNKQHVNYTELKSIKGVLGVIDDDRLQIVSPGVVDKVTEYIENNTKPHPHLRSQLKINSIKILINVGIKYLEP